jgi:ubiquitin C-terminal hydrolase
MSETPPPPPPQADERSIEQVLNFTKLGTGKSVFQNINAVSCYINCALQSLMHLDEFKVVFMAQPPPPHTSEMLMYWSLRAIYRGYWEENCVIRPMGIFAYLDKCGFPAGWQGDSTEVLTFIIEKMHGCIGVAMAPEAEAEAEAEAQSMEVLSIKDWRHHLDKKQSEVVNLFWGQYLNTKVCGTCTKPLYKFETFHYLTLAVAEEGDAEADITVPITFEVLVVRFRQKKQFDSDNLFFCDTCKQKVPQATDELSVWKLPRYLIVQFNRYHSRGGPTQKCNRDIIFPLMFNPAILQEGGGGGGDGTMYQLQSGVLHHGQIHGGHYTYFGWNQDTREWLYIDDDKWQTLRGPISKHPGIYQLIYKLI